MPRARGMARVSVMPLNVSAGTPLGMFGATLQALQAIQGVVRRTTEHAPNTAFCGMIE